MFTSISPTLQVTGGFGDQLPARGDLCGVEILKRSLPVSSKAGIALSRSSQLKRTFTAVDLHPLRLEDISDLINSLKSATSKRVGGQFWIISTSSTGRRTSGTELTMSATSGSSHRKPSKTTAKNRASSKRTKGQTKPLARPASRPSVLAGGRCSLLFTRGPRPQVFGDGLPGRAQSPSLIFFSPAPGLPKHGNILAIANLPRTRTRGSLEP